MSLHVWLVVFYLTELVMKAACAQGWHICASCKTFDHPLLHHSQSWMSKHPDGPKLPSLLPFCFYYGYGPCEYPGWLCSCLHACQVCLQMGHGQNVCPERLRMVSAEAAVLMSERMSSLGDSPPTTGMTSTPALTLTV